MSEILILVIFVSIIVNIVKAIGGTKTTNQGTNVGSLLILKGLV